MPLRNRDYIDALLSAYWPNPCPPFAPDWMLTSMRRRWSQLTRVRMRRIGPHPRPWEGPILDFSGVFFGPSVASLLNDAVKRPVEGWLSEPADE